MSSGMARFKTVSASFVTTAAWTRDGGRGANMGMWCPRYLVTSCDSFTDSEQYFQDEGIYHQTFTHHWEACRERIRGYEPGSER